MSSWLPLGDTPMHPEYPCAHCITSAAVASVLQAVTGELAGEIMLTSPTAPGVTRKWTRLQRFSLPFLERGRKRHMQEDRGVDGDDASFRTAERDARLSRCSILLAIGGSVDLIRHPVRPHPAPMRMESFQQLGPVGSVRDGGDGRRRFVRSWKPLSLLTKPPLREKVLFQALAVSS